MAFKQRSQGSSFKMMGSSPVEQSSFCITGKCGSQHKGGKLKTKKFGKEGTVLSRTIGNIKYKIKKIKKKRDIKKNTKIQDSKTSWKNPRTLS